MQDISDREVVAERRHHQCKRRHGDRCPARDARAPRRLRQAIVFAIERQHSGDERIRRERQSQKKRETTYLWHGKSNIRAALECTELSLNTILAEWLYFTRKPRQAVTPSERGVPFLAEVQGTRTRGALLLTTGNRRLATSSSHYPLTTTHCYHSFRSTLILHDSRPATSSTTCESS